MSDLPSAAREPEWAAFIGIDWADQKHAWSLQVPGAQQREQGTLEHSPEAIQVWISELTRRFAGRPMAVCLEQAARRLAVRLE